MSFHDGRWRSLSRRSLGSDRVEQIRCDLFWLWAYSSLCVLLPTPRRCFVPDRPSATCVRTKVLLPPKATLFPAGPTSKPGNGCITAAPPQDWAEVAAISVGRRPRRFARGLLHKPCIEIRESGVIRPLSWAGAAAPRSASQACRDLMLSPGPLIRRGLLDIGRSTHQFWR